MLEQAITTLSAVDEIAAISIASIMYGDRLRVLMKKLIDREIDSFSIPEVDEFKLLKVFYALSE